MKHKKSIKDIRKENYDVEKILRDIRTLSEPEEDYYKPIKILNAFDDNFVEYESNGEKGKTLSVKEYIDKIKPYLDDLIDEHKIEGEWKIQLTMTISFLLKISNETHNMHFKSNNIEIMINNYDKLWNRWND